MSVVKYEIRGIKNKNNVTMYYPNKFIQVYHEQEG